MALVEFLKKNVFTTTGRLNRLRYIKYFLAILALSFIVTFVLSLIIVLLGGDPEGIPVKVVTYAVNLAFFIGYVALVMRRLHDLNKDNWFAVLTLIPLVNLIFSIYLMAVPGTNGRNQYGEDPLRQR